jgi:hypothetical protein
MQAWKRPSSLAAVAMAAAVAACSPRSLLIVDSCPDGAAGGCALPPDGTLRQGLVGLWHFDDGAGSSMVADASGNGNDGSLVDLDPAVAWVEGRFGGGLQIGGSGYAEVPLSSSIGAIGTRVTVAAWVSLEGTVVEYSTAISRQIGEGIDQYYHISVNAPEQPNLFINTTVPSNRLAVMSASSAVPRATFTHIAGTYDGAVARLYVDGVLVDSMPASGTFGSDTTPLILGGNGNADEVTERFSGRIDEIALYNRSLDSDEIALLAAGALSSFTSPRAQ